MVGEGFAAAAWAAGAVLDDADFGDDAADGEPLLLEFELATTTMTISRTKAAARPICPYGPCAGCSRDGRGR